MRIRAVPRSNAWGAVCTILLVAACHRPPAEAMPNTTSSEKLVGPLWTLVTLNGQVTPPGAGGKQATLLFNENGHASGFTGCNRASGSYTASGTSLTFGPMAMTRMACAEGMQLEQAYSAALTTTRAYRISEHRLELLSGDTVLAQFQPRDATVADTL